MHKSIIFFSGICLLFIYIYIHYINSFILTNATLYSNSSLCSSLLDDVLYENDHDVCQLPCQLRTSFIIKNFQNNIYCGNVFSSFKMKKNVIIADSNFTIKQHKKDEKVNIISEIIEMNDLNTQISHWIIKFVPHSIKLNSYGSKLSVHFIMFDGGSRYVIKRQLKRTINYLKSIRNQYSMFDMLKYHTLDYNSFTHFSAMFYGYKLNVSNMNNEHHKLIFEDFKEENYMTINAHLVCDVYENFYLVNNYSGSDHNLNPPACDKLYKKRMFSKFPRCLGGKQIHQFYFDYLKDALSYYHEQQQPVFSKLILMDSHDDKLESLPRVDNDFYKYLQYLNDQGIMNKSVIIITSDHGIHYGRFYSTHIFPKSFTSKHKKFTKNLFINQNRFVTAFDIYQTMLDLAHNGKTKYGRTNNGISLFKRIPKNRNCMNQRVKFGCSCRVGNNEIDNDNYESIKIRIDDFNISPVIKIIH